MSGSNDKRKLGRLRRFLKYTGYIVIFIVATHLGQLWLTRDVVIGQAPAITGVDLDGEPLALKDYIGQPLLIYFWATWCPICRMENAVIDNLAEDYRVLSVALQSGSALEVKAHMKKHGINYRVINDPDGRIANYYGVRGVPTTFVISPEGEITNVLTGYTTGLTLRYRLWRLISTD